MMSTNRKITILYGSQTGTAQDLAEQIYRESKLYHFNGPVQSMDCYDVTNLINEAIVIFVCSTTGQGDEPDNMKSFWRFLLRRNLPSDSLRNLRYGVLGLGDSSYSKFNFVAKRLGKRLSQLGGREILPVGLCDDQHDLGASGVYFPWIADCWKKLLDICPLPAGLNVLTSIPQQYKWNILIVDDNKENIGGVKPDNADIYEGCVDPVFDKPFATKVLSNVRITSENHFQDVRLISFNSKHVQWSPGDVFVVRPFNSEEKVQDLFNLFSEHNLQLYPETLIQCHQIDAEMPIPAHLKRPLTLKTVATQLWDLNAIPRPRSFELLLINCKNELEREKLLEFTTAEGQQDLFAYANRPRRTIVETLRDFPHAMSQLNLQTIFELFQPMKSRSFSIASSKVSEKLDILLAIVEYKTMLQAPRLGLCSNWLKTLEPGDEVRGVIKKGTFRVPTNNAPIVMVGPGTGLAPFRSILQDQQKKWNGHQEFVLFFGCRSEAKDFHCRDELEAMTLSGFLRLFTAFSRDQQDKIYVQHKIREENVLLKDLLITKCGTFMVAGSSKTMPNSVKEALRIALGVDETYIEEMIRNGRYQEETW
ncbi:NADPH-dependent diflavin oxidoreductase 1 [Pseudolycoriella hygida]|uniref:NADPH-dependent diflavin oxidoreductase 1 n=1 Tax=Pseudolycoriella hygida TaxID=35572 RepID=A0A9Q0MVH2_9DIPT|nr:NADPH-dependent diflavin oxidoreductase 1 [Pseudolycoriella hygida]